MVIYHPWALTRTPQDILGRSRTLGHLPSLGPFTSRNPFPGPALPFLTGATRRFAETAKAAISANCRVARQQLDINSTSPSAPACEFIQLWQRWPHNGHLDPPSSGGAWTFGLGSPSAPSRRLAKMAIVRTFTSLCAPPGPRSAFFGCSVRAMWRECEHPLALSPSDPIGLEPRRVRSSVGRRSSLRPRSSTDTLRIVFNTARKCRLFVTKR